MPKFIVFIFDGLDHRIIPAEKLEQVLEENPGWSVSSEPMPLGEAESIIMSE